MEIYENGKGKIVLFGLIHSVYNKYKFNLS